MRNNLVDGELDILKFNTEISKAIKQTKDDEIKAELVVNSSFNIYRTSIIQ